jgi:hypothetical protein
MRVRVHPRVPEKRPDVTVEDAVKAFEHTLRSRARHSPGSMGRRWARRLRQVAGVRCSGGRARWLVHLSRNASHEEGFDRGRTRSREVAS